ncbi:MAG: peptidyl-prolyl cis-trans isomerase [Pseudomonadota bacterium]|nr:peptidyl-prolyl cis-trans isomerase [Pseudomonadota bacterium]
MRKIVKVLLILTSLSTATAFAETVYINGKPVDQKVIDQAMNQFKKSSPMAAQQMNNPQFKKQLLQSVGMQQAILMEGNSMGLDKSPEYQQKLQEIKPMIYAQILQDKASNSPVTDAQAQAKYDQMKKQMSSQKQYEVSHILVKDQKTADDIEAQLKKGANFADLAKKYSTDPGSKAKGGDLGWSDGSNYVPQFTAALTKLQKGQYTTTPVKSQFGYHIIKLNDVKTGNAGNIPPFAKVKDQIKQQLQMEKTRAFFDGLKAKYKVEIK